MYVFEILIGRESQVRSTQKCIKHVLRERWYAWEDAQHLWLTEADEQYQQELEEKKLKAKLREESKGKLKATSEA